MDTLFTTELDYNGKPESFAVTFHDDRYIFQSLTGNIRFSIRREEDEWHPAEPIDDQLKNAATEKLEAYLLSQH
jgi:hypothetical protein